MIRPVTIALTVTLGCAAADVDFARDIRPIFNAECTACHGGVKEAGDVSFIYREKALGTGESGRPVIVPGDPDGSELIRRVLSTDEDEVMPKPEHGPPLKPEQIELLRQWISEGAQWGEHWSFVKPEKSAPPQVERSGWTRNDIDHFILARLENEGLKPSAQADRAALLRRASLDLTGLPPTVAELDAFIADTSPDAYEKQVDRLLASPHFGERWASVWLDLARYADSEGLGMDHRRDVWKYRDWVIGAFNRDLPYDQFTIEQLGGDLIPDATLDQKIATAFHRLTQSNNEGGTDDEEFRVSAVIDRVSTTWEVWQGLTFGCVQCHSHPYDPIQHEEFYEFMEFFNQSVDADLQENYPRLTVPLDPGKHAIANELQDRIKSARSSLFGRRSKVDAGTTWHPVSGMSATARKAKLEIVEVDGREEYRSDSNVEAKAVYELVFPTDLETVTALEIEFLPLDEETARHTPEWGALLSRVRVELLQPGGQGTEIPLSEVIADEPHPLFDPNNSIRGKGRGWGTYSKTFGPRHAVIVPEAPIKPESGASLKVTIWNGDSILASFPMVSKRGRLALTDHPGWTTYREDPEVASLTELIKQSERELRRIKSTTVPVMAERHPSFPRSTHVFVRGNWLEKGNRIGQADTPELFPPLQTADSKPTRLDLANWIASPENPLTARVAVNRFWLELFGTGIVPTPEDFGSAGEGPSHPALLDNLAVRFANEMAWNVKSLLREIAVSATYRQDSKVTRELANSDPFNRLLARGPRQRLTAEMARDSNLLAGGLLNNELGGPPAHPPIPEGVWKPFSKDRWNTPEQGDPDRYRRAIYTYWKRSIPYPSFITFDAPTRETCSKRRLVSNTPLQALTVLNDPAYVECAKGLARRMADEAGDNLDLRLGWGYRTATSRQITPDRLAELHALFDDLENRYAEEPEAMGKLAQSPQQAALTVIASVLLNLDEALTR